MPRRYPCPHCAREMLLEKVHEGFEVPCPACGARFLVPQGATDDVPAAAATTAPASPRVTSPYSTPTGRVPEPSRSGGDDGTSAMIVGILGVVICGFLSPIAWWMGHKVRQEAIRAGREPPGQATAGWILGIIGTALVVIGGCLFAAYLAFVGSMIGGMR